MIGYLLLLGSVAHIASSSTYILSTLRGHTQPNRVTFLMWAAAAFIATAAALAEGVGWAVLPVFMSGFMPFVIFLSSYANKNAYWKLRKLDYMCGALSALALVLWVITNDPMVALVFALASDIAAAVPTIIKAYTNPESEHPGAFIGSTFNFGIVFLVASEYTFAALAFPVWLIFCNLSILIGIYRKRILKMVG